MNATETAGSATRYFLTLILTIVLVGGAGYCYIQQQKNFLLDEKRQELSTIADLKTSQIVQWRKERLIEATSIFSNAMMSHRVNDYLDGKETSTALKEFRAWMTSLHDSAGYRKVILFRADGQVISSVSDDTIPPTAFQLGMVAKAVREQGVVFSDLHRENATGTIEIDLFIPLLYFKENRSHCLAVLVFVIDPHTFLYPLIQSWPTTSESAETLLVEREGDDVLFLNELRHKKDTALTFRRPLAEKNMAGARAVLGQEGIFAGVDYRDASVLAATRTIPGSPWALVAKVDTLEIFATKRIFFLVAACISLVIAVALGMSLWWMRRQGLYLRKQYETELRFNSDLKQAELLLQKAHSRLEQRVAERTTELYETNTELRQEIAERKRLEQQLLEAKKLESIGQIAGGVAHEVRNPLNAILTICEALFREKGIEDNPEFEPYIEHIRTQVNRLAQLMNDLLDLGKSIPTNNLQPVALHKLCEDTIKLWSSGSTKKVQIILLAGQDSEEINVKADNVKLQQVFFNLLDNAAQHSPSDSNIVLRLGDSQTHKSSHGMTIVQISDTGKGIPEENILRVFDPFYTDRKGGTGLGLALVKHFIENMGGNVMIWNNNPAPGCTAEVHIPLAGEERT
ncbi:MAG TPA: sensor histidine kinase [Desulfuromonadaceae bacterium]